MILLRLEIESILVIIVWHVDVFVGIGGGPEGVIAAAALDAMNCNFQGRFIFEKDKDKVRAKQMGIENLNKKYEINEIVKGDSIFCATGITSGDLINGLKKEGNSIYTETLITHKSENLVSIIQRKYLSEWNLSMELIGKKIIFQNV